MMIDSIRHQDIHLEGDFTKYSPVPPSAGVNNGRSHPARCRHGMLRGGRVVTARELRGPKISGLQKHSVEGRSVGGRIALISPAMVLLAEPGLPGACGGGLNSMSMRRGIDIQVQLMCIP